MQNSTVCTGASNFSSSISTVRPDPIVWSAVSRLFVEGRAIPRGRGKPAGIGVLLKLGHPATNIPCNPRLLLVCSMSKVGFVLQHVPVEDFPELS